MGERPYHDIKIYAADGSLVAALEHVDEGVRDDFVAKLKMQVGSRIEIVCTCTR